MLLVKKVFKKFQILFNLLIISTGILDIYSLIADKTAWDCRFCV